MPLIEDFFQRPVEIESEDDVAFVADVLRSQMERQAARNGTPVFSPSQLSECLRYVYLLKHHKDFNIERAHKLQTSANYYFFLGNWIHVRWQFALYKMDKTLPDEKFKLLGVEVPILSKRKDHGGTADALCAIEMKPYLVDFKGLKVNSFMQIANGNIPLQYAIQLSDYGMLLNSQRNNQVQVFSGLLVSENKGGPDPKHPIAIHETEVPIKTYLPEVKYRLERLRTYAAEKAIPPPECESTKTLQFQGCPFRKFCREEVKEIERRRAKDSDASEPSVARSRRSRNHRSGRNSKR